MVAVTYDAAMVRVFADEGGYSNNPKDPGGATNWGITIGDARLYWKGDATAADVKAMPKSVASSIYSRHYATPLRYNDLPAGFDYTVFDAGINSGIARSIVWGAKVTKSNAVNINSVVNLANASPDKVALIQSFWKARVAFLRGLSTFSTFGKGWMRRCTGGEAAAVKMWLTFGAKVSEAATKVVMDQQAANAKTKAKTSGTAAAGTATGGGVGSTQVDLTGLQYGGKIALILVGTALAIAIGYFIYQTVLNNQRAAAYSAA